MEMMTSRKTIFLEKEGKYQLSDEYWYSFFGGKIKVFHKKALVTIEEAKQWDGFEIIPLKNQTIHVSRVTPPRENGEAVLWLIGLNKHERADTMMDLEPIVEGKRKKASEHDEKVVAGRDFVIFQFKEEPNDWQSVAGWADNGIKREEILRLIPLMDKYPSQYTQKVLQERFAINEREYKKTKLL